MGRSFKDLEIYKLAVEVRRDVFELVKKFPSDEKYRLVDQIIRSTRKCPANIAEGHGRYHFQENIQYCRIARGSLTETLEHLSVGQDCGYITNEEHRRLTETIERLIKMINGYISFLKRSKEK